MSRHGKARWRVVMQRADKANVALCQHRWGWAAEACAIRRENRDRHTVTGVFYTAYPADQLAAADARIFAEAERLLVDLDTGGDL